MQHRMIRTLAAAGLLLGQLPPQGVAQFYPTSPSALTFSGDSISGDFDGDGDADLCCCGTFTLVTLLENDGLGGMRDVSAGLPVRATAHRVVFIDIDGDGDQDLFATASSGNRMVRNLGGGAWADVSANVGWAAPFADVIAGDFDGDGDHDLAGASHPLFSGANQLLVNQGNGTFVPRNAIPGTGFTIGAGDIDGDGDLDIAVHQMGLHLWRNDGASTFTDVTATHLPPLPGVVRYLTRFGDVDGDGDLDLVIGDANNNANADRLLRNAGNGIFTVVPAAVPTTSSATSTLDLRDFDGDGDLDLLRTTIPTPTLALNDGSGLFTLATGRMPLPANVVGSARPVDLDRDGDLDVVVLAILQPGFVMWNHHRHVTVPTLPVVGGNWQVEVWGQPGYGAGTRIAVLGVGLARRQSPLLVPGLGALWLDVGAPFLLQPTAVAPGAAGVPQVFAIPASPQLVGIALHVQALIEETAGTRDVRLTSLMSTAIR